MIMLLIPGPGQPNRCDADETPTEWMRAGHARYPPRATSDPDGCMPRSELHCKGNTLQNIKLYIILHAMQALRSCCVRGVAPVLSSQGVRSSTCALPRTAWFLSAPAAPKVGNQRISTALRCRACLCWKWVGTLPHSSQPGLSPSTSHTSPLLGLKDMLHQVKSGTENEFDPCSWFPIQKCRRRARNIYI